MTGDSYAHVGLGKIGTTRHTSTNPMIGDHNLPCGDALGPLSERFCIPLRGQFSAFGLFVGVGRVFVVTFVDGSGVNWTVNDTRC